MASLRRICAPDTCPFPHLLGVCGQYDRALRPFRQGACCDLPLRAYGFGRGQSTPVGHNPLGAISVVLLLGLLLAQCLLGLFVTDVDGLESGPLSGLVSFDTSRTLAEWHGRLFTALQILVGIHVVAVLFYLFAKRENLIGPMVTGWKRFVETVAPLPIGKWWHAASALVVIALLVWLVVRNG